VNIRCLSSIDAGAIRGLSEVLIDCVEGGASVSFMAPLTRDRADAFWSEVIAGAARGERLLLVAKMLVHRTARRRGVGEALLASAEDLARQAGKTLLVLDTASGDAERLYAKRGWQRCGVIPGYALLPHGGLCDTTIFYRTL
jgi:GNAT superfamily N-acetyltransferase